MTLTLEVSPEKEARLREKAARRGQTLNDFLLKLVEGAAETEEAPAEPSNARLEAVRAIGSYNTRASAGLPPLSDTALSRESIYGDRGL